MKDRLFILTNNPGPFGTANANYIRNFARVVADNDRRNETDHTPKILEQSRGILIHWIIGGYFFHRACHKAGAYYEISDGGQNDLLEKL